MSGLRILVIGSRDWDDRDAIDRALRSVLMNYWTNGAPVLVHGAAPGADTLADQIWSTWRARQQDAGAAVPFEQPERWPARDFPSPRARNQHMVDLGAHVCLAFAQSWASGTGMCARMARRAGIPVVDYGVPTAPATASQVTS